MRDTHVEKFLLLPFSFGCESKSSVATAAKASTATLDTMKSVKNDQSKLSENGERKTTSSVKGKAKLEHSSSSVSQALHKLIKRILRRLSQLFLYEEENEPEEKEMEIGLPTDVKHVTHIGLDGVTRINNSISSSSLNSAENTCSQLQIPSISVEQFELAMAAQSRCSSTTPQTN